MTKVSELQQYACIISKLKAHEYVPKKELQQAVENSLYSRYNTTCGTNIRSLERRINDIEELFGIEIKCKRNKGYYISSVDKDYDIYSSLLFNFELLTSMDRDSVLQNYVFAEHHAPTMKVDVYLLLGAIENCHKVEFDYMLFRKNGKVVKVELKPYFLKQSQQRWYVVGVNERGEMRIFGLDRMENLVDVSEKFKRDMELSERIPKMFAESYGIWNNPDDSVEEIRLRYDRLDGSFVKSFPLHSSQKILVDDDSGIEISLRLRVTNDFVMALLSRSRSVEVLEPESLRLRIYDVCRQAAERNIPDRQKDYDKDQYY